MLAELMLGLTDLEEGRGKWGPSVWMRRRPPELSEGTSRIKEQRSQGQRSSRVGRAEGPGGTLLPDTNGIHGIGVGWRRVAKKPYSFIEGEEREDAGAEAGSFS